MIAYDTDVLVELLKGHPSYAAKARAIPKDEQFVPIVVVEEIQRGRLNEKKPGFSKKPGFWDWKSSERVLTAPGIERHPSRCSRPVGWL